MPGKQSRLPIYLSIANTLRERIEAGELEPNQLLPSETELAKNFNTSRVTIRQALGELRRENYIFTENGVGSCVSPMRFRGTFENGGFTRQCQILGYEPSSKVIDFKIIRAIPDIFRKIADISADVPIFSEGAYYLKRIRYVNETPVSIQKSIIPKKPFPGLDKIDFSNHSIFMELSKRFDKRPSITDMMFLPVMANQVEADYLQISLRDPLMASWSVIYSQDKSIMECSHSLETNKFAFRVKFSYDLGFRVQKDVVP